MADQAIESSLSKNKRAHPKLRNFFSNQVTQLLMLCAILLLFMLNIVQLVFVSDLLKAEDESRLLIEEIHGATQSIDGLPVLVDEMASLDSQTTSVDQKVDTIVGMVRDLKSPASDTLQPTLLAATFNIHFLCIDAETDDPVAACPIGIKVIAVEPVREFEILGSNQQAISLPVRVRLSIAVQAIGYKPFASVFEFVETGEIQEYQIKLEKY